MKNSDFKPEWIFFCSEVTIMHKKTWSEISIPSKMVFTRIFLNQCKIHAGVISLRSLKKTLQPFTYQYRSEISRRRVSASVFLTEVKFHFGYLCVWFHRVKKILFHHLESVFHTEWRHRKLYHSEFYSFVDYKINKLFTKNKMKVGFWKFSLLAKALET